MLASRVAPANAGDCYAVATHAEAAQDAIGDSVELACIDKGYTGERPVQAAAAHGIALEVIRFPQVKRGVVLLPRRWVLEWSLGWIVRFCRLTRGYERLPAALADLHFIAFVILLLRKTADFAVVRNTL